jgi:hypothetical protein
MDETKVGKIEQLSRKPCQLPSYPLPQKRNLHTWSIEICKSGDNFTATWFEEMEDHVAHRSEVFECDGLERDTMTGLLEWVAEHFGSQETSYNKWGKENLRISWDKHGSKV